MNECVYDNYLITFQVLSKHVCFNVFPFLCLVSLNGIIPDVNKKGQSASYWTILLEAIEKENKNIRWKTNFTKINAWLRMLNISTWYWRCFCARPFLSLYVSDPSYFLWLPCSMYLWNLIHIQKHSRVHAHIHVYFLFSSSFVIYVESTSTELLIKIKFMFVPK